jgi:hypothetical protein
MPHAQQALAHKLCNITHVPDANVPGPEYVIIFAHQQATICYLALSVYQYHGWFFAAGWLTLRSSATTS